MRLALLLLPLALGCASTGGHGLPPEAAWPSPEEANVPAAPAAPRLSLRYPADGAQLPGGRPAYLSGLALPPGVSARRDIVLVLDVSGSTAESATKPPRSGNAREGSILAAEVAAARALLDSGALEGGRLALVTFSGEPYAPRGRSVPESYRDARTVTPLTTDRSAIEHGLERILKRRPSGMTDMAEGLRRGVAELVGGPYSKSAPDLTAQRIVIVLTDGVPTLPYPGFLAGNETAVLAEVDRAVRYRVRIYSLGVGSEALDRPLVLVDMAARTGGTFLPVRDPARLPEILPLLPFVEWSEFHVRNLTLGREALAVELHADASFDALVPLADGSNRIEVEATASDGQVARTSLRVERRPGSPPPELPPDLVARRGAVIDLARARQREERRHRLLAELREERAAARERAREERRDLELAPAPGADPAP